MYISTSSSCAASLCIPTSLWLSGYTPIHQYILSRYPFSNSFETKEGLSTGFETSSKPVLFKYNFTFLLQRIFVSKVKILFAPQQMMLSTHLTLKIYFCTKFYEEIYVAPPPPLLENVLLFNPLYTIFWTPTDVCKVFKCDEKLPTEGLYHEEM